MNYNTVCAKLPTKHGDFTLMVFNDYYSGEHVALLKGEVENKEKVLTRVHSECFTGDVLESLRCDCGWQLQEAMRRIAAEDSGALIYLRQEGRGIGLTKKIMAYGLQDEKGFDTVEANRALGEKADDRDYAPAARILNFLGVKSVRLLTNNPAKVRGLEENGVKVVERHPLLSAPNEFNRAYLETKREKLNHLL